MTLEPSGNSVTSTLSGTTVKAAFYAEHPRALIAKRMINGILQTVQAGRATHYVPIRPGSDHLVERKKRISPTVLGKLKDEIRAAFWTAYRFDTEMVRMANELWSDSELDFLWGSFRGGALVWPQPLLKRARAEVGEDWKKFCQVEGLLILR